MSISKEKLEARKAELTEGLQNGNNELIKAQDNLKALSGALQQVNLFLAELEKEQSEQTYNDVKIEDVAQEGENSWLIMLEWVLVVFLTKCNQNLKKTK
jgi:hypothetical protein